MASFVLDEPVAVGSWAELRARLQPALQSLPSGLVRERWAEDEEALFLEGSGVNVEVRWVDGRVRVVADLGPPASFFASTIEEKLRRALAELDTL